MKFTWMHIILVYEVCAFRGASCYQACAVRSGHGGDPPDPSIHGSLFSGRVGLKPSDWSFQIAPQRAPPLRRPRTSWTTLKHAIHSYNFEYVRIDDWYGIRLSTCYIVRSQGDSTSSITPSMHPKQRTIMHIIHILGNIFGLMIGVALNSLRATFLPTVTRLCAWHLACLLNNVQSWTNQLPAYSNWLLISYSMFGLLHCLYSQCLDITDPTECARTDVVSVRVLPCDIKIQYTSVIPNPFYTEPLDIPNDFTWWRIFLSQIDPFLPNPPSSSMLAIPNAETMEPPYWI